MRRTRLTPIGDEHGIIAANEAKAGPAIGHDAAIAAGDQAFAII